jgi:hypothetical protein
LEDTTKSAQLAQVFRALFVIMDDGDASYANGTMQFVMSSESADKVAELIRAMGLPVVVRDQ